jgi:hypothetical protein
VRFISDRVSDPIEDFLSEYEELANDCGLTDHQKVETIICYIPFSLRDFWKSLDGYFELAHDWANLGRELEAIYVGPSALSRHAEHRLLLCQTFMCER